MMYAGTNVTQDNRFCDKEQKILKQMKFAVILKEKIDVTKVRLDVLKPWISDRMIEMLGLEDDVLVEFVVSQLEENRFPDPKKIQMNLTGFLNGKNARDFMKNLWKMLLSAQSSASGIPEELLIQKREEINNRIMEQERADKIIKNSLEESMKHLREKQDLSSQRDVERTHGHKTNRQHSDLIEKQKEKRSYRSERDLNERSKLSDRPRSKYEKNPHGETVKDRKRKHHLLDGNKTEERDVKNSKIEPERKIHPEKINNRDADEMKKSPAREKTETDHSNITIEVKGNDSDEEKKCDVKKPGDVQKRRNYRNNKISMGKERPKECEKQVDGIESGIRLAKKSKQNKIAKKSKKDKKKKSKKTRRESSIDSLSTIDEELEQKLRRRAIRSLKKKLAA